MKKISLKDQLKNKVFPNLPKILETISDGVAICGSDSTFLMVNSSFCNMLRVDEDKLVGRKPNQAVQEGLYNKSLIRKVIKTKKEVCDILVLGSGEEAMSRCRPIFDENGKLQFVVSTATNITELKKLRESIEHERMKSEAYLREIEHLRKKLLLNSDFVCESPHMKSVLQMVKKIAPMDCMVFITGESGVGKEVIGKIIHTNSLRKDSPFIPVSIPAIPENLLESELFGYEEGAFTGSLKGGKIGYFELAQKGTLFLDEIGDIPLNLQVKLLRAIETREIVRLGGKKPIKLDVRIIAATNKDLQFAIRKGNFREDLYYRLNVIPLTIESLRKRKEDIWPLSLHFLNNLNIRYGMDKELSPSVLEELKKYDWPGNVRELKNYIERLAILSNKNLITKEDIKSPLKERQTERQLPDLVRNDKQTTHSIWNIYKSSEKNKILEALDKTHGNKSSAAKILGIPRSKLYRKLNSEYE